MDYAILTALYYWAIAHPKLSAFILGLWVAALVWKGLPEADRKALEVRYPRPIGVLRVTLGALPDPWDVVRGFVFSVILGKPHPGSVPQPPLIAVADVERILAEEAAKAIAGLNADDGDALIKAVAKLAMDSNRAAVVNLPDDAPIPPVIIGDEAPK